MRLVHLQKKVGSFIAARINLLGYIAVGITLASPSQSSELHTHTVHQTFHDDNATVP